MTDEKSIPTKKVLNTLIPKIVDALARHEMIWQIELKIGFGDIGKRLGIVRERTENQYQCDRLLAPFTLEIEMKPSSPSFTDTDPFPRERYDYSKVDDEIHSSLQELAEYLRYCPLHVVVKQVHADNLIKGPSFQTHEYKNEYTISADKSNADSVDAIRAYQALFQVNRR